MRELPRGAVTFVFTDIEGSTRLLHELGDQYSRALAEHRRILRRAFEHHGGVEVDTQGDAFFFAFPSAAEAVEAAAAGQAALEAGPVRVRMGVHTGQPEVTDEGYVGLDVHLGARVAAAGHGGQVLLSKATKELVDGEVSDLGEHRLKDFDESVWLFQLGNGAFPPLKTVSNTNLPRPASSFVGREREKAAVVSLFRDGARLVTLTGPGGSGKTRLALEAAAELVPELANGVFWVGLAPLRDPSLVAQTIGQTIGAKSGLVEHLGERELLLLLDNFEQVVEAASELASIVEACPNLRLLVTSRELLRVRGEVAYPVQPLNEVEAVALFRARAGLECNEMVTELCRRIDNLPLAVELAAARTAALTPQQILERLSERLDLLKGGRDADPRQRTLRATIEWSYELLPGDEQRSFARLAVFAGGATLDAALDICEADLETLQSLVEKSLLRLAHGRFWMLETIRDFAGERLLERGEGELLRGRHAGWYVELAGRLELQLRYGEPEATASVTAELDNMRAGLEWLVGRGNVAEAIRLLDGLWYFWITRGLVTEGLRWANWAAAEAGNAPPADRALGLLDASELFRVFGEPERALLIKRELLPHLRELSPERNYPATLSDLADILAEAGRFDEARELGAEAVAWRRSLGVSTGIGHALSNLGAVEFRAGNFTLARNLSEEALVLFEEPYVPTMLALAALLAAESARRTGDRRGALPLFLRALRLCRELGQRGTFPELLQEIAAAGVEPSDSARLLGASERLLRETGMPRTEEADHDRTVARLLAELGDDGFWEAWAQGVDMAEEDALALAERCLD